MVSAIIAVLPTALEAKATAADTAAMAPAKVATARERAASAPTAIDAVTDTDTNKFNADTDNKATDTDRALEANLPRAS